MEMAASYEDSVFLEAVLRYKPNLGRVGTNLNHTPMEAAITYERLHNLELLIAAGANLDNNDRGKTPVQMAANANRYDYVYLMLQAGANPAITIPSGPNASQNSLAWSINHGRVDPDSDVYVWRERLIAYLKTKGIVAEKPSDEKKRTKPLPADLQSSP